MVSTGEVNTGLTLVMLSFYTFRRDIQILFCYETVLFRFLATYDPFSGASPGIIL